MNFVLCSRKMGLFSGVFLCCVVLLLSGVSAFGQETTGGLAGTVLDQSGAMVPGVTIEATSTTQARPLVAVTNETGNYLLGSLPVGKYVVTATMTGFSTLKKTDVNVIIGRTTRLDFTLQLGTVAESLIVTADSALVDATTSSSAITIDESFFDILPKGRGFYDLIGLAPGARNETKSGGFQIDGASGSENTYYVDGMEITDVQEGVLASQNRIPVEAVQQIQVKNGVMDAQYGGAMGGVVNAVVRGGTNSFHGQAGFYFNNDGMQARPRPTLEMDPTDDSRSKGRYFQNSLDDYSKWNPVFQVGGPIVKDKLFFFSGYMPSRTVTNRTVKFLSNSQTSDFSEKRIQNYTVNKLDYSPLNKLRMGMSWIWNPHYLRGTLPARQGTDSPDRDWAGLGSYSAGNILTGQVDYIASNKLVFSFRGGYHFSNYRNAYALSNLTHIYSTSNLAFPELPASLRVNSTGWVQQGTARTDYDNYDRVNLSADGSYLASWQGQHNLKFGWQTNRLSNSVSALSYPNGYFRFYWNQSYSCVTSQCSGKQRGTYGYYRWYTYGTLGDASSDNQGLYLQDSWRVNKNVTLNLGIRFEREFLPSFSKAGIAAAPPIEFGWGKKVSPRIGVAWDPQGDGKMRLYGSWGYFFDTMKYEMPRGSFGGDIYLTYYYALDDPTIFNTLKTYGYPTDPSKLPGRFFEGINWRIPSNDPEDSTVDPELKPMKQQMMDLGFDYSINPSLVASVRYTNRRLIRTIEDVGTLGPDGEVYFIANPGFGLTADPKTWDVGFPTTPKAKRHYDAVEFRLEQRFASNYQYAASYTWSRSFGNYSGLASSDEDGRTSPNVNRYFDTAWLGYNEQGQFAEGRLGTDRPHTFKFFGAYTLKNSLGETVLAPTVELYSGTPLTTQINAISSTPVYPYSRGDLGRTPVFFASDLNIMHDFKPFKNSETMKVRLELTIFNLFNSSIATNKDQTLLHVDDGRLQFANDADIFKGFDTKGLMAAQDRRVSPLYGLASGFQGPRELRLQLAFFF